MRQLMVIILGIVLAVHLNSGLMSEPKSGAEAKTEARPAVNWRAESLASAVIMATKENKVIFAYFYFNKESGQFPVNPDAALQKCSDETCIFAKIPVTTNKDKSGKLFISDGNARFFKENRLALSAIGIALDPYGNLIDKLSPPLSSAKIISLLEKSGKKFNALQNELKDILKIARARTFAGDSEDADIQDVKKKLNTIKNDIKMGGQDTLYDITDYIQQQYKIPIIYAADVRAQGIPSEKKTISLVGLTLESGLRILLEQYGLAYVIDRELKCLKIIHIDDFEGELEWRMYNVDDLVRPIPDFPAPDIELPSTPGGAGWKLPQVDLPPAASMSVDEIIELIKKNTGKDRKGESTWDKIKGVSIRKMADGNRILVVHTGSTHGEIGDFLEKIR